MNPFADPEPNPWMPPQENTRGPRYGNAYEDEPKHECDKTEYYSMDPYEDQKIAWDQPSSVADAYQYTGTRYGNAPDAFARGGDDYTTIDTSSPTPQSKSQIHDEPQPLPVTAHPSRKRLILRIIQLLAAVGHLGFAAGASPYSKHQVPFSDKSCFYYLFAVAILSILWSLFHIPFYFYRRFSPEKKLKRPVLIATDTAMAVLWGVGTIVEIAKYHCSPGGYNHWCDFYNVSIFFGMLSFVSYIMALAWDFVGPLLLRRRKIMQQIQ